QEQRRGWDVDPFEPALDRREVRTDEILHLGAELIDQESAAGPDHARRRFGDGIAYARRKGREGEAGEHIIRPAQGVVGEDLLYVRSGAVDRHQSRIVDRLPEVACE